MKQTGNIKLNFLHNYQIHKEVLINENSVIIDSLMLGGISSMKTIPDEKCVIGTKYIIPPTEKDYWKDKKDHLAIKLEDRWQIVEPKEGMIFWITEEEKQVVYSNSSWRTIGSTANTLL